MNIKPILVLSLIFTFLIVSCEDREKDQPVKTKKNETASSPTNLPEAMISKAQFSALNMKIDTLGQRVMSGFVKANGELEVPPQSEATVTSVLGANVVAILVIEGENVKKGQALAYIAHPDIIKIQSAFLNAGTQLEFEKKEFNRQEKLYKAGVGSGELYQKAEATLKIAQGKFNGLKAQLSLLNLNTGNVLNGKIQSRVALKSPITGAVQKVNVKTGQFVEAQTNLFEIVNTEHVHADLMVFEKDVSKVKVGQEVKFTVESGSGEELSAKILSISQSFEKEPKAVHVHAEIIEKTPNLIPGMYVRGKIIVDNQKTLAVPEEAIAKNADKYFIFYAEREGEDWSFKPIEVIPGNTNSGWVEVSLLDPLVSEAKIAYNNAYYLMAEMQKGEGGHSH